MPGLKRGAEELLPLSRPAKVARTVERRPSGESPSPSQYDGLASRWAYLGVQAMLLVKDTIGALRVAFGSPDGASPREGEQPGTRSVHGQHLPGTLTTSASEGYLASPPPSRAPSPKPKSKLPPPPPPARAPVRAPVASSSRSSFDVIPQRSILRDRSDVAASTPSVTLAQPQLWPKEAKRIDTGLPSPPSSRLGSASSTSFVGMYPDLAEKIDAARAMEESAAIRKRKQQIQHRQHIYHNQVCVDVRGRVLLLV